MCGASVGWFSILLKPGGAGFGGGVIPVAPAVRMAILCSASDLAIGGLSVA